MKKNKKLTLAEINYELIRDLMNEIGDIKAHNKEIGNKLDRMSRDNTHNIDVMYGTILKIQKELIELKPKEHTSKSPMEQYKEIENAKHTLRVLNIAQKELCYPGCMRDSKYYELERQIMIVEDKLKNLEQQYESTKDEKPMEMTEEAINALRKSSDFETTDYNNKWHYFFQGREIIIIP